MKPPRALFLDFDGVIADTENHHVAAWQETFGLLGWEVNDEVCIRGSELEDENFLVEVFSSRKITAGDIKGWSARKQSILKQMLADSPRLYPGVAELVGRVKKLGGVKLAVVTSAWRDNVATVLRGTGLYDAFSLIVARDDVRAHKPEPDCFLFALSSLGISAGEAIALECSQNGLRAAAKAGVQTFAVGHRREMGAWTAGAAYLSDLRKPDELIRQMGFAGME